MRKGDTFHCSALRRASGALATVLRSPYCTSASNNATWGAAYRACGAQGEKLSHALDAADRRTEAAPSLRGQHVRTTSDLLLAAPALPDANGTTRDLVLRTERAAVLLALVCLDRLQELTRLAPIACSVLPCNAHLLCSTRHKRSGVKPRRGWQSVECR